MQSQVDCQPIDYNNSDSLQSVAVCSIRTHSVLGIVKCKYVQARNRFGEISYTTMRLLLLKLRKFDVNVAHILYSPFNDGERERE